MNTPDPNAKPNGFAKWMGWIVLLALLGLAGIILAPKLLDKTDQATKAESIELQRVQPEEPARKKPTFDTR